MRHSCLFSLQLSAWMLCGLDEKWSHRLTGRSSTGRCGCIGVGTALWRKWGWGAEGVL